MTKITKSPKQVQSPLFQFLYSRRCIKGSDYEITHTMLPGTNPKIYGGRYSITEKSDRTKLFQLYYNHVNAKLPIHLTEANLGKSPMKIDLDFRFKPTSQEKDNIITRKYTSKTIKKFIGYFWEEFDKLIPNNLIDKKRCKAFIQEKSAPRLDKKSGLIKDGIHIMFPSIVTIPEISYIIRSRLLNNKDVVSLFKKIGCCNNIKDIIDEAVIDRNNWFMYGSHKPNGEAYKCTMILDRNGHKINKEYTFEEYVLIFSLQRYRDKDIFLPEKDNDTSVMAKLFKKIDKIFEGLKIKKKVKDKMTTFKKAERTAEKLKKNTADPEILGLTKLFVKCLKNERASDYDSWIRLGWVLHNIDYNLLALWKEFSKKCAGKYSEQVCDREWEWMNNNGLGYGTLRLWAQQDNPKEFNKIIERNVKELCKKVRDNVNPSEVAMIIKEKYKYKFKCVNMGKKIWYQYENHRWREMAEGVQLRSKLSREIVTLFEEFKITRFKEIDNLCKISGNEDDIKDLQDKEGKKICKIISELKKTAFKDNVLKECAEQFYDPKFIEKLDTNPNLIGMENGVYDLEALEFRDGYPEDYISFSTGNDYIEYEEDDEEIKAIRDFLSKVLPIKAVRDYTTTLLSTFLCGRIFAERFHILTGFGGNGKSKLTDLFKMAFSGYCSTFPVSILTKTRSNGENASPVMASTKGIRCLTLQEPENDAKLNTGFMKELTGGDIIKARGLFKDPIEFKPQFKLVLICNDMPNPGGGASDDGTWRRIRVIPFIAKFCENPTKKYEFPINEKMDETLVQLKEAFFWYLIQEWKQFKDNNYRIAEPKEIKVKTSEYRSDTDLFTEYIKLHIHTNDSLTTGLKISKIWNSYKSWFTTDKCDEKPPAKKALKAAFEQLYGKYHDNYGFRGIAFNVESNLDDMENDIEKNI